MRPYSIILGIFILIVNNLSAYATPDFTFKGFLENKGQLTNGTGIHFYTLTPGKNIYFKSGAVSYVKRAILENGSYQDHRIDVQFVGSNSSCQPKAELIANSYSTYYGGEKQNLIHTRHYKQIVYKDLYDGIDLVYRFTDDGLVKYEFLAHPYADASQIKIQYNGLSAPLTIDSGGQMLVPTSLGNIYEQAPLTFYQNQEKIKSSYNLKGNVASFTLADYDRERSIIIDPTILWSTFLGGSANDLGQCPRDRFKIEHLHNW